MADDFAVHESDGCRCFPRGKLIAQWRPPTPHRAVLTLAFGLVVIAIAAGELGPAAWGWERVTVLALSGFGAFIAATVPDHFLDEHLWEHVARRHVPRIFAWTFGTLAALALLEATVDLGEVVSLHPWPMLAAAALVGLVPESGPHLIFVTLYGSGNIGLSALVASSAVQDGHGMLPLLAHSRSDFLRVKEVNLLFGAAAGAAVLLIGS